MAVHLTFAALGDPTRRALVERLTRGEATVSELAVPHDMSLPAVTKHLRVLEDAGLLTRRKRGRTVVCSLNRAPLAEAESWLIDRQRLWSANLDRLERFLIEERDA
ncbi:ArsR/SmtB family transcription factor [Oryzihumus sp.]